MKCWNWFKTADQKRGAGEPSLIAGITHEVMNKYQVDPSQVYLAGMSAGGAMAAIVGTTYPDLYAAIGIHSGLAPGIAKDLSSALIAMQGGGLSHLSHYGSLEKLDQFVPTIIFHGDNDRTVHAKNAELLRQCWIHGNPEVAIKIHKDQIPNGYAYTCTTHYDMEGCALMEQWTIHGLDHAWSGGSLSGSYTDPKGPDASLEMIKFFNWLSARLAKG
jgi:poly(3-hydroxybutyrate) depolymerase